MTVPSLLKPASQKILDPVNLGSDVAGGEASDFADLGGVQSLEIRQDHVTIERCELLNQAQQAIERMTAIGGMLAVGVCQILQFLQSDQGLWPGAALSQHVRRSDIVRNTIDPRTSRTAPVEGGETAPQCNMNFLQQISPKTRISLVSA